MTLRKFGEHEANRGREVKDYRNWGLINMGSRTAMPQTESGIAGGNRSL